MAIDANLNLKQSREEVKAAEENRKASITRFFPTLSTSYDYCTATKNSPRNSPGLGRVQTLLCVPMINIPL